MSVFISIMPADCVENSIELRGERYHHLARVCRVRVGEELRAALPDGRVLLTVVSEISTEAIIANVIGEGERLPEQRCRITLCPAVLKGEKMELVVQKATELGAYAIAPLWAERCIPRWDAKQGKERAERWSRIAASAAEQSERALPPIVTPPRVLADFLATPGVRNIFLLHEREGQTLTQVAAAHAGIIELALLIGPEGGWTSGETEKILAAGATPLHISRQVFRAETASIAALVVAQLTWGGWGE